MTKRFVLGLLLGMIGALFSGPAMAQHGHGGMSMPAPKPGPSQEMPMKSGATQSATVEGLKVTFEVMTAEEHMKMAKAQHGGGHSGMGAGKSHHFMVTLQDTASKEIINDAKVTFTVQGPSGGKETGKLTWEGDHYAGEIDLKAKGRYQVQLMIESGGMDREARFTYEAK